MYTSPDAIAAGVMVRFDQCTSLTFAVEINFVSLFEDQVCLSTGIQANLSLPHLLCTCAVACSHCSSEVCGLSSSPRLSSFLLQDCLLSFSKTVFFPF